MEFASEFHEALVQRATSLPICGKLKCITSLTAQSVCSVTDATCICTNEDLTAAITTCVLSNCTVVEQLATTKYSKDSCGVEPVDRTAQVVIVPMVFGALALLAFGVRVMSRVHMGHGTWGMGDWAITAAVVFMIPLLILSIPLSQYGLGKDIWNIPSSNITEVLYLYYWDEIVYFPSTALTKISILLFYLEVFKRSIAGVQPAIYTLIILNVLYALIFDFVSIFQCTPVQGAWLFWDDQHQVTCRNINAQGWASAGINIVLDLAMVILPLPELWQLSLSNNKKLQVMLMFSLGFLVTIVSILRLHSLVAFGNTTNLTQDYVIVGVWTTVEVPVGVICACLPAVRAVLKVYWPTVFDSTRPSRSDYYNQSGSPSASKAMRSHLEASGNHDAWKTTTTTVTTEAFKSPKEESSWDRAPALELQHMQQDRSRSNSNVFDKEPTRPKEMS
ncbi:hypothetical protein E8E14_009184 [Neopestalotiopsis sp. 37M]|nr:hypothetical protein E8E14_009184 [Neopestalotiopsis sp. 37M]